MALLEIETKGKWGVGSIPFKKLANIQMGEPCLAIGNALGEGLSVTTGTVSRIDRTGGRTLIRTSAPVSHGNSGGPLFANTGAALIGIICSGLDSQVAQNVKFAIPIEFAFDPENLEFYY